MFNKPVIDFKGHELKAHLRGFLHDALICGQSLAEAEQKMEFFGREARYGSGCGVSIVDDALKQWVKKIDAAVTRENQAETNAEISLRNADIVFPRSVPDVGDRGFRNTSRRSFRDDLISCDDTDLEAQMVILDDLLAVVDFDAVAAFFGQQAQSLVKTGYEDAANTIAEFLALRGYTPEATKLTPKGLVFFSMYGGVNHGMDRFYFQDDLGKAVDALKIAERDLGISGVAQALSVVQRGLNEYPGFETIPSRTEIGLTNSLSAIVFKGKTKFTLEASRADALLSFIAQYGSVELPDLKAAA